MQYALTPIWLVGWLALMVFHCDNSPVIQDASPQVTQEGLNALESVSGRWLVTGTLFDSCPSEASIDFPQGETIWSAVDGELWLEGAKGGQSALLKLVPSDAMTFVRTVNASWNDCASTQSVTLNIASRDELIMEGTFSGTTRLTDGIFCPLEIDTSPFPCETRLEWTALRL